MYLVTLHHWPCVWTAMESLQHPVDCSALYRSDWCWEVIIGVKWINLFRFSLTVSGGSDLSEASGSSSLWVCVVLHDVAPGLHLHADRYRLKLSDHRYSQKWWWWWWFAFCLHCMIYKLNFGWKLLKDMECWNNCRIDQLKWLKDFQFFLKSWW